MSLHLQREIEKLKKKILTLGTFVEDNLQSAKSAFYTKDKNINLAKEMAEKDKRVDEMEVEIEEECLKILALHQPVATDLRFVISVLKINNDLERVSDLAVNIAKKNYLFDADNPCPVDFDKMFSLVQKMLNDSINSLITMDVSLARNTCLADDQVDDMKRAAKEHVLNMMKNTEGDNQLFLATIIISRNLERIADLATNIAEDVIYMVEGSIVRHQAG